MATQASSYLTRHGGTIWRSLRRLVFGAVCLVTLVALFYAEENVRGKRAWDAYVREQTAKGGKLSFTEFIPRPVPEEQNLALCPLLKPALDLDFRIVTNGRVTRVIRGPQLFRDTNGLNRLARLNRTWSVAQYHSTAPKHRTADGYKEQKAYAALLNRLEANPTLTNGWIDLAGWAALYRTGTNLPPLQGTNSPAADVLLALRPLESDLEELRQEALRRPLARWPIFYNLNNPVGILLPHLAKGKSIAAVLQLRAAAELNLGHAQDGLSDLELGFRLAETFKDEPFLISQLVRNACYGLLLQPLKEGLARHEFSDPQLAHLQKELEAVDVLATYQNCVSSERAFHSDWSKYFVSSREAGFDWKKAINVEIEGGDTMVLALMPSGWIYRNQITLGRIYDEICLPALAVQPRRVYPRIGSDAEERKSHLRGPFAVIARLMFPLGDFARKFAHTQTQLDQAVIGCALERYRLVHAAYPTTLDQLSPHFLETIPHDLVSGEPLKYRRMDTGRYVLYSIGWNEVDDGGLQAKEADWVWSMTDPENDSGH